MTHLHSASDDSDSCRAPYYPTVGPPVLSVTDKPAWYRCALRIAFPKCPHHVNSHMCFSSSHPDRLINPQSGGSCVRRRWLLRCCQLRQSSILLKLSDAILWLQKPNLSARQLTAIQTKPIRIRCVDSSSLYSNVFHHQYPIETAEHTILINLQAVSLGCAPTPNQYLARSTSSLISLNFLPFSPWATSLGVCGIGS